MNTGEHTEHTEGSGGGGVYEEWTEREAAPAELRRRLEDGPARVRLTRTQFVQGSGRSRTIVQQAFQKDAPVSSAATVAALAHALDLPEGGLPELRRTAGRGGRPRGRGRAGAGAGQADHRVGSA